MTKTAGRVRTETGHKRVRAYLGGELVADTSAPVLVWEWPYFPVYYFPAADVQAKLIPAGETEHSPSRGDAEIYHVQVPGTTAEKAARRYPGSPLEDLRDLVRLDWDAMSEWFEEDEPVYTHARDPYTHGGRLPAAARPVRDRPAAALLPAADRRADGPAAALGHPDPLPVQGRRQLLVGAGW